MSRYHILDPERCQKWLAKDHYWVLRDWADEASEYKSFEDFMVCNHYHLLEEYAKTQ